MDYVNRMVDEFLKWRLPEDFSPDAGVVFTKPPNWHWWPTGTNLLTAVQARAMFEHCAESLLEDLARKDTDCQSNGRRATELEAELARLREERDVALADAHAAVLAQREAITARNMAYAELDDARKREQECQIELARVREELAIEKAKFPTMGSPLQKLGAMLADLLDEDRFSRAEQLMLSAHAEQERVARRAYLQGHQDAGHGICAPITGVAQAMRGGRPMIGDFLTRLRYTLIVLFIDRPDTLAQRVRVENVLARAWQEKRALPPDACRDLAQHLGVPSWARRPMP